MLGQVAESGYGPDLDQGPKGLLVGSRHVIQPLDDIAKRVFRVLRPSERKFARLVGDAPDFTPGLDGLHGARGILAPERAGTVMADAVARAELLHAQPPPDVGIKAAYCFYCLVALV